MEVFSRISFSSITQYSLSHLILASIVCLLLVYNKPVKVLFGLLDLLKVLIDTKQTGWRIVKDKNDTNDEWSFLNDWEARVKKTPDCLFLQLVTKSNQSGYASATKENKNNIINPSTLTFRETDILSDRISCVFYTQLLCNVMHPNDVSLKQIPSDFPPVVALLLPSSPFFVACYLGLVKAGACGGLINTNLRGKALGHAIRLALDSKPKIDSDVPQTTYPCILVVQNGILLDRINDLDVRQVLKELKVKIFVKESDQLTSLSKNNEGNQLSQKCFDQLLTLMDSSKSKSILSTMKSNPIHKPRWDSNFFYVFTSGTTGGLAKASIIKHIRYRISGAPLSICARLTTKDKIYTALPLYHSAAGMIGVCGCILSGACMVIRPKFSASEFASDLVKYECTIIQYIGEFARYTLASKVSEAEKVLQERRKHKSLFWDLNNLKWGSNNRKQWNGVRVAFGNGMRPEVWQSFQDRFGIGDIMEFYGSTEGNANMINNCSIVGCIGVIPNFILPLYPICLVKCDPLTGEILRDPKTNLAILCKANEPGQLLGLITKNMKRTKQTDPTRMFEGYTDSNASKKKIVHNVRYKNDSWFATGDLLQKDWFGFYYWVDRIGDTFRWKGENVSTCEVAAAFVDLSPSNIIKNDNLIVDVNVYGVELPGYPGRAGMARITLKEGKKSHDLDFKELYKTLEGQLAIYARPLFLRIGKDSYNDSMTTSTFKLMKGVLREQGFNPFYCDSEEIFLRDDVNKSFTLLTQSLYEDIILSKLKF